MPVTKVSSNNIRYRHTPSQPGAPTLLLLHVAGSSSLAWSAVFRQFDGTFEVVAPDLPGHGQSTGEPLQSIKEMAEFTRLFMDAIGVTSAVLAGHSMGGAIALQVALDTPNRVRGLLLVSTGARLGVSPAIFAMIENDFESMASVIGAVPQKGAITASTRQLEPVFPQTTQSGVRRDFQACADFDVRARLGEIQCPTAILIGSDDIMTPLRGSQQLQNAIPFASLHVEEATGHMLPRQRPRLVAEQARKLVQAVFP